MNLASLPRHLIQRTRIFAQPFHSGKGSLVDLGPDGKPATKEVNLWHGDPGEAYVIIPMDIGRELQKGEVLANGISLKQNSETHPLLFFHTSRTFANSEPQ